MDNNIESLKNLPIGDLIREFNSGQIPINANTLSEIVAHAFTNQKDQVREYMPEIAATTLQEAPNMSRDMLSSLSSLISNENTELEFIISNENEDDIAAWNTWAEFRALKEGLGTALRVMERHNIG